MSQVKVYGVEAQLRPIINKLSDTIHSCVMDALAFPADKRAHRFFPLQADEFFYPEGRSEAYTIIEITMI
ncbi:MAG: tautomerase family protein, partial [Nitrospinota bacterium]|nr:tautomerase family protein [Nitrospinota bacterium]